MADSFVIGGLRRKRAEMSGEILATNRALKKLRDDLDPLDRTLRLLDPTIEVADIRPVVRHKGARLFRRGECSRAILNILRKMPEPVTSLDLMDRLVVDFRLNIDTPGAQKWLRKKVRVILVYHRGGALACERRGEKELWSVTPPSAAANIR